MSDKKQVLIVEDQDEAISALRYNRPDLVLLDIMMPRKSGIHVFRAMKNDPRLTDVPVIVVTGMSQATGVDLQTGRQTAVEDEGDVTLRGIGSALREKVQGLAPDGLIEKPVDARMLVAKIEELLS